MWRCFPGRNSGRRVAFTIRFTKPKAETDPQRIMRPYSHLLMAETVGRGHILTFIRRYKTTKHLDVVARRTFGSDSFGDERERAALDQDYQITAPCENDPFVFTRHRLKNHSQQMRETSCKFKPDIIRKTHLFPKYGIYSPPIPKKVGQYRCIQYRPGEPDDTAAKLDVRRYIRDNTEVTRDHLTPEVKLHLITPSCPLWSSCGEDCQVVDPFWAFYWPGGQALTRYLLDNPSVVKGRTVLDVGSGCGASSIASVMSGARRVIANDICPVAAEAIEMNMAANHVGLEINTRNLIGHCSDEWEVVLLGDMFYDDEFTNSVTSWLEALHSLGKTILIGDPGRVYFNRHPLKERLRLVYSVDLMQHTMEENSGITQGYVWTFC